MAVKPKPGDYACGSCGRPVRLTGPEPARLCCKKIWHLARPADNKRRANGPEEGE